MKYTEWEGFVGGEWEYEINVRDFIQKNYTPYYIGGTIGVLILIGGAYVLKRNKKNSNNIEE